MLRNLLFETNNRVHCRIIEQGRYCLVTCMDLDFCVDYRELLWLSKISNINVAHLAGHMPHTGEDKVNEKLRLNKQHLYYLKKLRPHQEGIRLALGKGGSRILQLYDEDYAPDEDTEGEKQSTYRNKRYFLNEYRKSFTFEEEDENMEEKSLVSRSVQIPKWATILEQFLENADIFQLASLGEETNPPPAVKLLMSALTVMTEGSSFGWNKVCVELKDGDMFLQRLRNLRYFTFNENSLESAAKLLRRQDMSPDAVFPQHAIAGCVSLFLWVSLLEWKMMGKFTESWLAEKSVETVKEISRMTSRPKDIHELSFEMESQIREEKLQADISERFSKYRSKVPSLHFPSASSSSVEPHALNVPKHYYRKFQKDLSKASRQLSEAGFQLPPHLQELQLQFQKEEEEAAAATPDVGTQPAAISKNVSKSAAKSFRKQADTFSPYHSVSVSQLNYYDWDKDNYLGRPKDRTKKYIPHMEDKNLENRVARSPASPTIGSPDSEKLSTRQRTSSPIKEGRVKCGEGSFRLPYLLMGTQDNERQSYNFIIINDIFDDFRQLRRIIPSSILDQSQVMLFNLPKQARAKGKGDNSETLNVNFYAQCLEDLLHKLNNQGKFFTTANAADAALRKVNESNQRRMGGSASMKFTDANGNMLPQAMPQKYHIVAFGFGAAIATEFVRTCEKDFHSLLGYVVLANGILHPSPPMKEKLENTMELFGSFPDSASDIPFTHVAKLFLSNTKDSALAEFHDSISKSLPHSAYIDMLDSVLDVGDLRPCVSKLGNPFVIWDTNQNRLIDAPLGENLNVTFTTVIDEQEQSNIFVTPHCLRTIQEDYPELTEEGAKAALFFDHNAIEKIKQGIRNPRTRILLKSSGGHYIPQEASLKLWQLFMTLSNPEQTYHMFEPDSVDNSSQEEQNSWQKVTDISSSGIVNPLRTLNPGEKEEFEKRTNFTLDGKPKELHVKNGQESTTSNQDGIHPGESAVENSISGVLPKKGESTFEEIYQLEDSFEPESDGLGNEDDTTVQSLSAFGITYSEVQNKQLQRERRHAEQTDQRLKKFQAQREKKAKRQYKREVEALQAEAMARRIVQNQERKVEELQEGKRFPKDQLARKLETELTKLENASGVVLYGATGPNVEYFPDTSRKLRKGSKPIFGKEANDSDLSDVIDLEGDKTGQTAADTVPLPGQKRLTNEEVTKLARKELSLEELAPESLPGVAEVHPFSPLGKALNLIRTEGKVHDTKHKDRKVSDNPSAAEASYLQLATFKPMREHQKSMGPGREPLDLLNDERFEEVLEANDVNYDLYMKRQAKFAELRAAAAYRAIDYDSPAIKIQKIIRGHLGRKRAREFWILMCLYRMQTEASIAIQKIVRGYQSRVKYKAMRAKMLRLWTIQRSAERIQIAYRHHVKRCKFMARRWETAAVQVQRGVRGFLGRLRFARLKARYDRIRRSHKAAAMIQAHFRRWICQKEYNELLIWNLSAKTLQRHWKGCIARRKIRKVRYFENYNPGIQQVAYGLQTIEPELERLQNIRESLSLSRYKLFREEHKLKKLKATKKLLAKSMDHLDTRLNGIKEQKQKLDGMRKQEQSLKTSIDSDVAFIKKYSTSGSGDIGALTDRETRRLQSMKSKTDEKNEELSELLMAANLKEASINKEEQELNYKGEQLREKIQYVELEMSKCRGIIEKLSRTCEHAIGKYGEAGVSTKALRSRQKQAIEDFESKSQENVKELKKNNEDRERYEKQNDQKLLLSGPVATFKKSLDSLFKKGTGYYATQNALLSPLIPKKNEEEQYALSFNNGYEKVLSDSERYLILGVERQKAMHSASVEKQELISTFLRQNEFSQFNQSIRYWSVDDMCRWLTAADLSEYQDIFRSREIDGDTFMDLSDEDIREVLGIKAKSHYKKILNFRQMLESGVSASHAADSTAAMLKDHQEVKSTQKRLKELSKGELPSSEKLFALVRDGRKGAVEKGLQAGFNPDSFDRSGKAPLHIAAIKAHLGIIKLLVRYGANVNLSDFQQQNTPLHYAVANDPSRESVQFLLGRGADPSKVNSFGREAMEGA